MSETDAEFLDPSTIGSREASEIVENDDGTIDLFFEDLNDETLDIDFEHTENLAEFCDEDCLTEIGTLAIDAYNTDLSSRREWEDNTLAGIDQLGIEVIEGGDPFEGACTATHPLILENSIKFQSKASNELLPAQGPVKTKIIGTSTEDTEKQAARVRLDMNHQTQHEISEYYDETERALFFAPFLGNAFKRKAFDYERNRIVDEFILPDRFVVNSHAKSLLTAERLSYLDRYSERRVENLMDSGFFRDLMPLSASDSIGDPYPPNYTDFERRIKEIQGVNCEESSHDAIYEIVEQHCHLKLNEETGELDEHVRSHPYIVYVEVNSGVVLAIYRNWSEDDPTYQRLEWFTHYPFVMTSGFYAWGYLHLLGNLNRTITVAMRSLADAGQFANLPAGFKMKTARIAGDNEPLCFGEFRDVEISSMVNDIRQVFMPMPFKEPSTVLLELMSRLEATGQKFADSTEQVVADSTNYGPVGTTMALLEASTRFFAAVYKRIHRAQAHELKIISRLMYEYLPDAYPRSIDPTGEFSRVEDYDPAILDIIPVSDPNFSSQAQRLAKANVISDTAQKFPGAHNPTEVVRYIYSSLDLEETWIERLVPAATKPEMLDPVSDILAAIKGTPIAAFKGQDHQAHIVVKSAWLQDPENGGSEQMQAVQAVMLANIREHTFMKYTEELEAVAAAEKVSLEQAAARISRLNQIAREEEQEGSPAKILADAEMIRAETAASKEVRETKNDQIKLGIDLLGVAADIEKIKGDLAKDGKEIDLKLMGQAIDLLVKGQDAVIQKEKMSDSNANKASKSTEQ